ncbi:TETRATRICOPEPTIDE REPEAT (TPR)-LIKE SUPERFAMILY PROTEIN-RELATED [Salix viminalis]|uniref:TETRATRICOPEPTIDE REPEAT (TPR)-LIKE SUPERFAMILY PROTEIN-RELATED n=1 Tax=Salix viminalis TaxID=40686 RepID=A0A9Q0SGB4_SALVM|nr:TETRATRICOPEPTIDE REPEAT (TPR)-LIKE SUPERFAMILY PROTEIN-RELATED [Salix viminalis]
MLTQRTNPSRLLYLRPPKSYPFTTATATPPPPQQPLEPAALATLILTSSNPQALAQTLYSPTIQWTPQLVNIILKRLWNDGPKALQFFNLLSHHPSYSHHASSFDHAIDISARIRDFPSLRSLVYRMRSSRLGPSPKTFAIIAERYASTGKPHRAVKVFLSMHQFGCFQDLQSFNTILDVLCKSKRVEMAYNLFKAFKGKFRADRVSYNVMVNGWCLINRTNKALEMLKEMVKRGLTPNLISYNTMLKGYFRAGQINEAWNFFLEMKKRDCEIDVVTYTTVIHGFGVAGEIKRARKVFDTMVKKGVLPSVATYNAFIQVLCKKDSVDNAIVIFEEMVVKGYVPNSITYNLVIRGLCHRGEIDKALDLFQKMTSGDCLPNLDTYNILISAMFVRKKSDDLLVAGNLLIEMVDRGFVPRKFTFNRVLNGLLLTGNVLQNPGMMNENTLHGQSKDLDLERIFLTSMVYALKKVINELESGSFGVLDNIEEENQNETRNSAFLPTSVTSLFSDPYFLHSMCLLWPLPPKPMRSLLKEGAILVQCR